MAGLHLNLDSFPDSRYAEQLRRGFGRLRFPPPMESEFAAYQLGTVIWRVRVWQFVMLLMTVGIVWLRLIRADSGLGADLVARIGIMIPCSVFLVWASWSRHFDRWYPMALRWVVPALYAVSMMLASQSVGNGLTTVLIVPTIALLAASLLIGALFYRTLFLTSLIIITYLAGARYFGLHGLNFHYHMVLLLVMWLVGCALAYSVEKSGRTAFLQTGLLGEMVSQDGLTGLHNRRAFDERLVSIWQQALRERRTLGILMIDIDHFKPYNDRYGHQAGDAALRRVSQAVKEFSRRPLDMAARYGGEEFGLLFYDLDDSAVETIAEQIRRSVQQLGIEHGDSPHGTVTVTLGVALVRPTLERSPAGAVQLADEALYAAKLEGRNRVKVLIHEQSNVITGQFRKPEPRKTA